jgi:hypothetical protein
MSTVTKSVSAENTWTDPLEVLNDFDLSISGTFVGTVTVQRSFDGGSVWRDVDTFTAPIETAGFQPSFSNYRVGINTGDYTSGTAVVTLIDNNLSQR